MAFFIAVQNNALLFAHCGKANGSQPQRLLLYLHDFADAFVGERQHCLHFLVAEGVAFGGALDFNERAAIVHDDVHVGLGFAVFGIFQIEQRRAAVHADGDGGELAVQRVLFEASLLDKGADGVGKRDETTANRCGARAAVGLETVAVNCDSAFAERGERPMRRWISTVRPCCLPRADSRTVRSWVARGSMPYSAVTQP